MKEFKLSIYTMSSGMHGYTMHTFTDVGDVIALLS